MDSMIGSDTAEWPRRRELTRFSIRPRTQEVGIEFEPIEGDPAVLMKLCVENGMFTLSFMKEATLHFRSWIEGLLDYPGRAERGIGGYSDLQRSG